MKKVSALLLLSIILFIGCNISNFDLFKNIEDPELEELSESYVPQRINATEGRYSGKVVVRWDKVNLAEKYLIFRSDVSSDNYTEIGTAVSNSYDDSSSVSLKHYSYKVKSVLFSEKESVFSKSTVGWSNEIGIITLSAPNVRGTSITNNTMPTWSWGSVNNAIEYRFNFSNDFTSSSPKTTNLYYTPDLFLSDGVYTIYVRAVNKNGEWSDSGSFTTTIDTTSLSIPVILTGGATNDTTPTWNWEEVDGSTAYRYQLNSETGDWKEVSSSTTSVTAQSALSDGVYILYVKAQNDAGTWSDSGSRTLIIDTVIPEDPVVSGDEITTDDTPIWSWDAPTGVDHFVYRLNSGAWQLTEDISTTTFTPGSSLFDGDNTLYVKAVDSAGNESGIGSFVINVDTSGLDAPVGVSVTKGNYINKITLTWNSVTGAENYYVYRSTSVNGEYIEVSSTPFLVFDDSTIIDTDLTYYYKVKSHDSVKGYSAFSGYDYGYILAIPKNVIATDGIDQDKVSVGWSSVNGAVKYNIYRALTATGTYDLFSSNVTVTIFNDLSTTSGSKYFYKVTAVNSDGLESDKSEYDEGYKKLLTTENISATDHTFIDKITIVWDNVTGADKYDIYRSETIDGTYFKINTGNIYSTFYDDTTCSSGVFYYYKVLSINGTVESEQSYYDEGCLKLSAPVNISASNDNIDFIKITWDEVPGADKYDVYRSTNIAGPFEKINGTDVDGLYFDDTSIISRIEYFYKVIAYSTLLSHFSDYSLIDDGISQIDVNELVFITGTSGTPVELQGRDVTLNDFYIGKYEVVYKLWYEVYQWAIINGYSFDNPGQEGYDGVPGAVPSSNGEENQPVSDVHWYDSIVWCNAYTEYYNFTKGTSLTCTYTYNSNIIRDSSYSGRTAGDNAIFDHSASGFRLPTEAEWEYATAGHLGTYTTYSGGDYVNEVGWYLHNSSDTHQVAELAPNEYGTFDMTGNIIEWCWDWYDDIGTDAEDNPTGAASGSSRVLRGGSFQSAAVYQIENDERAMGTPDLENTRKGFRVVKN